MAAVYQIRRWDKTFEKAKSREVDSCSYVCLPNHQDGEGLKNVLYEPDGLEIYGMWVLLVQRCSRQGKPRAGWLTEDGKPTGRPWTDDSLARVFGCEKIKVARLFQVVTNELVGWLTIYERGAGGQLVSAEGQQVPAEGQQVSAEGQQVSSPSQLALPEKEASDGYLVPAEGQQVPSKYTHKGKEGNGKEEREEALSGEGDFLQHAEAKLLLSLLGKDVFDKKNLAVGWPRQWEYWLDEALPIAREDLELISWAYRLPDTHQLWTVTGRRQSFEKILENLSSEPQKLRNARKLIGMNGASKPKLIGDDWPAGARDVALEIWGEKKELPKRYADLAPSARRELEEHMRT